jgi:hypothetical protein
VLGLQADKPALAKAANATTVVVFIMGTPSYFYYSFCLTALFIIETNYKEISPVV